MADEIIKSVRIDDTRGNADGSKLELWSSNRKKWVIWNDYINKGESKKFAKMDAANSDEYVLKAGLGEGGGFEFGQPKYKIIQDPYRDTPPSKRIYGKTPYYLTDGSRIVIKWLRQKEDTDAQVVMQDLGNGVSKPVYEEVTSNNDNADTLKVSDKIVEIFPPESSGIKDSYKLTKSYGIQRTKDTFPWDLDTSLNNPVAYSSDSRDGYKENSWRDNEDKDVLEVIIAYLQSSITYENMSKLKLCFPDTETCSVIKFEDYIKDPEQKIETPTTPVVVSATPSNIQIPLNILDFPEDLQLRVGEDLPEFKVYIGDLPPNGTEGLDWDNYDELDLLDPEFIETEFKGDEESPLILPEVPAALNSVNETGNVGSFDSSSVSLGKVVKLPETYSHTTNQGFNIIDSKWFGDLVTSAKSHVKTPTYDISGTDNGNLGCASAVSIIFYRAFGVHIKTGKSVSSNPKSVGEFGSKSTTDLGNWFESNPTLWSRVEWESAQPGDIMNTSRGSSAGHIGIVIDERDNDGSYIIISNSSKGFAGGGGGAVKKNYSVKKWGSVRKRNPNKTFAWRYKGPKESAKTA